MQNNRVHKDHLTNLLQASKHEALSNSDVVLQ